MSKEINSDKLLHVLAIISILGYTGIIIESIFNFSVSKYIESIMIILLGLGIIYQTNFRTLKTIFRGFNSNNFPQLTTEIIGLIAIVTGLLSIPYFNITNPTFLSIKGILSIIAVVVIFIQTWAVKTPDKKK